MQLLFEQLLGEILSLPGLALALLLFIVIIKRYYAQKKKDKAPTGAENNEAPATDALPASQEQEKLPSVNLRRSRIFLIALLFFGLLLSAIFIFRSHFNFSLSMIISLASGAILYALTSLALLRSKQALKQLFADLSMVFTILLLLAAGSVIVQVIGIGIGLGPLKFLLFTMLALLGDFLLQITNSNHSVRDFRPGRKFAPAALALFLLILVGPEREWLAAPLELASRFSRLLPLFTLIIVLPYLLIAVGRRFSPGRNKYWSTLKYLLSFELAFCAIGLSVSIIHRIEISSCSEITDAENLTVLNYQAGLLSDALIVEGDILASMKEGKSIDRFIIDEDLRKRIRLPWSPERITYDPESELIFSIPVDQTNAPIAVLEADPLQIHSLIDIPGCPKSYWSIEELEKNRLWILCNSRENNIYVIDTEQGKQIAEFADEGNWGDYFYGAIDKTARRLWTVSLYYGISTEFEIIDSPTLGLRRLRTMPGFKSLVQDVALDYEAGLLIISRNLQLKPFPFGAIYAYHLDTLEPAWEIPIYSARYMALDKKNGRLYVISLADGGLHVIDYKNGKLLKSMFVGQQVRSVRVDDSGAVIVASKCGAVLYLPDGAVTESNLQFLEKIKHYRGQVR
jgi:hypothetical protein